LHRTYIAGIEAGARNVTLKSIEKLAKALEVSISDLLNPGAEASQPGAASTRVADILLVEDNQEDVTLALEAFHQARFTNPVHVVGDGATALDFLFRQGAFKSRQSEALPKIILLDLGLPRVGGLEVLRRIRQDARTREIPVIVLTASQSESDFIASKRLGADDYIVKPVDFQNFCRVTPGLHLEWALLESGEQLP
jgi:CheY-like chemotaxis protein